MAATVLTTAAAIAGIARPRRGQTVCSALRRPVNAKAKASAIIPARIPYACGTLTD